MAAEPRSAVDGLLELWLAASLDIDKSEALDDQKSETSSTTAEVQLLVLYWRDGVVFSATSVWSIN